MEPANNLKTNAAGTASVVKDANLVSWVVNCTEGLDGKVLSNVTVTFSSRQRPDTQGGAKQGSHTSAYALILAQIMQLVEKFAPTSERDFHGINKLVEEMMLILERDRQFLEKFNLIGLCPTVAEAPSIFQIELDDEVWAQQQNTRAALGSLRETLSAVQKYAQNTDSLTAKDVVGQEILAHLHNINPTHFEGLGLDARRSYCFNVVTLAAHKLLEMANKAPYVTFQEPTAQDEDEELYRKGEGRRIRDAMAVLMTYSLSGLVVTQDLDLADEEGQSTEEKLLEKEGMSLDGSDATNNDAAASTSSTTEQQNTRRLLPARGKQILPNLSDKVLKTNVTHQKKDSQETAREERAKQTKKIEGIVNAIYDLLYYPPMTSEYLAANQEEGRRTNNLDALCYVITKHLDMVFGTFDGLIQLNEKDMIIERFLNKMMDDWGAVIEEEQNNTLNQLPLKKREELKENIIEALKEWQQSRDVFRSKLLNESNSDNNEGQDNNFSLDVSTADHLEVSSASRLPRSDQKSAIAASSRPMLRSSENPFFDQQNAATDGLLFSPKKPIEENPSAFSLAKKGVLLSPISEGLKTSATANEMKSSASPFLAPPIATTQTPIKNLGASLSAEKMPLRGQTQGRPITLAQRAQKGIEAAKKKREQAEAAKEKSLTGGVKKPFKPGGS